MRYPITPVPKPRQTKAGQESHLEQFSGLRRPGQKASDREVVDAYLSAGSVARAAKLLGMCGQSVHERVVKLGVVKHHNVWTEEEIAKVRSLYECGFETGDGKLKALAESINRTVPFISRKAKDLGLSNINRKCNERLSKEFSDRSKKYIQDNGHPRGALGMKHSEETRATISKKSQEMWRNFSEEQMAETRLKAAKTAVKNGTWNRPRHKTTWKQGWREIGGSRNYYRSRWEANYARYLEWLKQVGEISEWEHEPKTFWFEGVKRGTVSYLPDFRVTEKNGDSAYHEVKGWMDDRSKTKIKRMAKYHPDVTLIVIDSKAYKALSKKVGSMIDGWE